MRDVGWLVSAAAWQTFKVTWEVGLHAQAGTSAMRAVPFPWLGSWAVWMEKES